MHLLQGMVVDYAGYGSLQDRTWNCVNGSSSGLSALNGLKTGILVFRYGTHGKENIGSRMGVLTARTYVNFWFSPGCFWPVGFLVYATKVYVASFQVIYFDFCDFSSYWFSTFCRVCLQVIFLKGLILQGFRVYGSHRSPGNAGNVSVCECEKCGCDLSHDRHIRKWLYLTGLRGFMSLGTLLNDIKEAGGRNKKSG